MATVWARTSGNWSGSVWDWINPETEQVEAYPYASPQSGDYVYLNGYSINLSNNINIGNGTISNAENPNTGRTGGYFNYTQSTTTNWNYIANFVVDGVQMIRATGNRAAFYCTVNGNISLNNAPFYKNTSTTSGVWGVQEFYINGNITGNFYLIDYDSTATTSPLVNEVRIVGTYGSTELITSHTISSLTVVGETGRVNATTANITGTISTRINSLNDVCVFTTLNINGKIEYHSTNNTMGIRCTNLNILNPDTFTWHDVTNPRTNHFIIITDWDLNNEVQYPNENRVVAGTPYAFDEKVGTFTVDYPPETVVLKDYAYDGGEMVGTLDLPQAPTTSDIVTAIKNDSDLGGKINTTNTNVGNISTAVTTIDGKVDIIDTNVDTLLSRLTSVLTQRLGQSVTVEILQQILVAHLDN